MQFQSPKRSGMFRPKLRYAHQGGMNPPVIVITETPWSMSRTPGAFSKERFRKGVRHIGTPLRIRAQELQQPVRRQARYDPLNRVRHRDCGKGAGLQQHS